MIIVTGGAGFIGSNIVFALNARERDDLIVVDDLTKGKKFHNLVGAKILDYWDKEYFLSKLEYDDLEQPIEAIFHEGACSTTTEWNGKFMMENNYEYSKMLLHYCLANKIQFIYASSAAIYGNNTTFVETLENEAPINVYGYSKYLFDQYVRRLLPDAQSQVVGMRYFNVYGPRESHKGTMASVAYHQYQQMNAQGIIKLFAGYHGYGDGEQRRDFIYVDDVVSVNLWFLDHKEKSGIFNVGTGRSEPFNNIAKAVIDFYKYGEIEYIPFPENLKDHYQSFTQADLGQLQKVGYTMPFKRVNEGVRTYLTWLEKHKNF